VGLGIAKSCRQSTMPHSARECIAGIHGLSIDTIELYERNMIDELALRLVHVELPVGS
jgi:hypothetical protein